MNPAVKGLPSTEINSSIHLKLRIQKPGIQPIQRSTRLIGSFFTPHSAVLQVLRQCSDGTVDFSLIEFGHRVRLLRRAQGLTQEQLAEAADLNTRTVQKIEAGKIDIVLTTMARVQAALGCSGGELFDHGPVLILYDSNTRTRTEPNPPSGGPQQNGR